MIVARCPQCQTTFRVTPEQLRARAGKVRCGQCSTVFDALDALVDTPLAAGAATAVSPPVTVAAPTASARAFAPETGAAAAPDAAPELPPEAPEVTLPDPTEDARPAGNAVAAEPVVEPDPAPVLQTEQKSELLAEAPAERQVEAESEAPPAVDHFIGDAPAPDAAVESADEVMQKAQAVGLVAARDTREVPGYSKWAEQPLAGQADAFASPARGPRWPAAVFALLLLLGLGAQAIFHFRAEIAAQWPETRHWLVLACSEFGCSVPLPRQADLVSIEGSELQADPNRGGLLVLQATLKNRAAFPLAYPALELTLTDTQDSAVVRRVLLPQDYLHPRQDPAGAFAANGDLAVKLWIEAREAGAAGYRLYVYYP